LSGPPSDLERRVISETVPETDVVIGVDTQHLPSAWYVRYRHPCL